MDALPLLRSLRYLKQTEKQGRTPPEDRVSVWRTLSILRSRLSEEYGTGARDSSFRAEARNLPHHPTERFLGCGPYDEIKRR
jgi:hypothetical protein